MAPKNSKTIHVPFFSFHPSLYYRSRLLGSLPGGSEVAGDVRDMPSIPGSGRCPGGGSGNPFQHSGLGNPIDRGAWMSPSPASSFFLYISSSSPINLLVKIDWASCFEGIFSGKT